jgi:hypothetical protein
VRDLDASELAELTPQQLPSGPGDSMNSTVLELKDLDAVLADALADMLTPANVCIETCSFLLSISSPYGGSFDINP